MVRSCKNRLLRNWEKIAKIVRHAAWGDPQPLGESLERFLGPLARSLSGRISQFLAVFDFFTPSDARGSETTYVFSNAYRSGDLRSKYFALRTS